MSKKSKNVSQADLRKLMSSRMTKKPTKRATSTVPSTTEDLIALKKIKLLQQEGKRKEIKKTSETGSSLVNKITHNADKV